MTSESSSAASADRPARADSPAPPPTTWWKGFFEMAYWRITKWRQGMLANRHYEAFFTSHFGLTRSDYAGKRVLDIGCGPRGSLEWADGAEERVGLDPLAGKYRALGTGGHSMRYVEARAEEIPFATGHFDVVTSFNSLDHVDSVPDVLTEIGRVTRPGGLFLLITDVGHSPTLTEPQTFGWEIAHHPVLAGSFDLESMHRFERLKGQIYESIRRATPFDERDGKSRYGVLTARFRRREAPGG